MSREFIGGLPDEYVTPLQDELAGVLKLKTGRDFSKDEIGEMLNNGSFPDEINDAVEKFFTNFNLRLLRATLNYVHEESEQLKALEFIVDNLPAEIASQVKEKNRGSSSQQWSPHAGKGGKGIC